MPPEFGEISSLRVLRLEDNHLTGPIPSEYGELSNLEVLDISANTLTGFVPDSFSSLNSINDLRLGQNKLRGKLLPILGSMYDLRHIDIQGCMFEDDGLSRKIRNLFPHIEGLIE